MTGKTPIDVFVDGTTKGIGKSSWLLSWMNRILNGILIDASHAKAHAHAHGACGGSQAIGLTKKGCNTKIHLAVDAYGMPGRVIITAGPAADGTQAKQLTQGMETKALIADKRLRYRRHRRSRREPWRQGGDSSEIKSQAAEQLRQATLSIQAPGRKRFSKALALAGIATRYAKKASSFLAIVQIRGALLWMVNTLTLQPALAGNVPKWFTQNMSNVEEKGDDLRAARAVASKRRNGHIPNGKNYAHETAPYYQKSNILETMTITMMQSFECSIKLIMTFLV